MISTINDERADNVDQSVDNVQNTNVANLKAFTSCFGLCDALSSMMQEVLSQPRIYNSDEYECQKGHTHR